MKFLTEPTAKLLKELTDYSYLSKFTFVGGSALGYYLNHRLSEDLDFFTWEKKLPAETDSFLKHFSEIHQTEITNFNTQNLELLSDGVKLTFFSYDWEPLQQHRSLLDGNIFIAHPDLLCGMKINTISLRAKFRDYYDLYVLNLEKYDIKEMYQIAQKYLPGITKKIFSMQLSYIEDIVDENINYLNPKYEVSLTEIQQHFIKKLRWL